MPLYDDSYPAAKWRRLLSTTWPLFRAFRVDVRVSWSIALWPLVFWYMHSKWLPAGEALVWGIGFTVALFATVYTHEMGHILAGRRVGVDSSRITLRALGGLAHADAPAPNPKAEIFISLAGPATHLVWLAVLYPLQSLFGSLDAPLKAAWALDWFIGLNVALAVFNLLPFWPMDGGKTLRAWLSERMHPNRASMITANVGYGGAVVIGMVGLGLGLPGVDWFRSDSWSFMLVWIAIENFFSCRRLQMEAKYSTGPYEPVEAWKQGGVEEPWKASLVEAEKLNREADRHERKAAAARRKAEDQRRKLVARIDELLDRINEVGGIENLSAAERRELEEASATLNQSRG